MSCIRTLVASPLVALVLAGCGGAGDAPPIDLTSPSAACEEAFVAAAEAGERAAAEEPGSPDIDALDETLEACGTAEAWLTGVRGNPDALPLELDRETALDVLCERDAGTPVCEDWRSSGSGAGRGDAPAAPSPTG